MLRPRLAAGLVVVLLCAGTAGAGLTTISHEGRAYVELARVAETLKTTLEATAESTQARLRTSAHVVTFTRNWSRILIDGSPVVLDAPVVVRKGTWLVPETFLAQVMPKLVATVPAPPPAPTVILPAPATLEELRTRSYPSFTRIVLETSGPVVHRVETAGGQEVEGLAHQLAVLLEMLEGPAAPVHPHHRAVVEEDVVEGQRRDGTGGEAEHQVAAPDAQGPEGGLGVAAAHGVDNHVDAPTRELPSPRLEILVLIGDRGFGAHGFGRRQLLLARRRRQRPQAEGAGHIDGGQTDAAAGPEDEHRLAGGDDGAPGEGEEHGDVALHEARPLAEADGLGQGEQGLGGHGHLLGEGAQAAPQDAVANCPCLDAVSHGRYHPGRLAAGHEGQGRLDLIAAADDEGVGEGDARGSHVDHDLPRSRLQGVGVLNLEAVGRPQLPADHTPHLWSVGAGPAFQAFPLDTRRALRHVGAAGL